MKQLLITRDQAWTRMDGAVVHDLNHEVSVEIEKMKKDASA